MVGSEFFQISRCDASCVGVRDGSHRAEVLRGPSSSSAAQRHSHGTISAIGFWDEKGRQWEVRPGYRTDGASILHEAELATTPAVNPGVRNVTAEATTYECARPFIGVEGHEHRWTDGLQTVCGKILAFTQ